MAKTLEIVSIGFQLPGGFSEYVDFSSKASLLDFDIILFRPELPNFSWASETYLGKPALSDDRSVHLRECAAHWKREISEAQREGKTVIVFLTEVREVYVATGERQHSGTGRNRQTTRIVVPFNNYSMLPTAISATTAKGRAMSLTSNAEPIAEYWKEFGQHSTFEVLLNGKLAAPFVVTKSGRKPVGGLIKYKGSHGRLLLLPNLDLNQSSFLEEYRSTGNTTNEDGLEDGDLIWSDAARRFGGKLRHVLERIHAGFQKVKDATVPPDWASDSAYALPRETELQRQLLEIDVQMEQLVARQQNLKDAILNEGSLRGLLFEQGQPLEHSIQAALELLGFVASNYKEADSEFDVMFEAPEGRFIGEAEGKDTKAINISKLRQLEMNLLEDLARDDVSEMAHGVLFGNAERLAPVGERGEFFTEKVLAAAKRTGTALVRTPDLFSVAQYLSAEDDPKFRALCRLAILDAKGEIVQFPAVPTSTKHEVVRESDST